MKKTFALLLTLVMVFGLVASMPAYADDEIIINFPSIWVGTDSKAAYMSKMIEDFNAENAGKIKVVVEEQTDYQAYRDKIRTTITTGNAPDLCVLDTTFDIKAYAESGKFMDLTPYLNEGWGENFTDGAFDAWSVDGKVSILPFEAAVFPLVYNVEILKAAGWDHFPATYDEFFQMCKDVKAAGFNAMGQMAGDNAWSSMLWYSLIVEAIGGKDVYADGLDNPAFVEAAKVLKEMYNYTFDGAVSATASDVNGHFIARDTAVYLNGPWWIANLYKDDNAVDGVKLADVCDVATNPVYEGGKDDGKGLVTTVQGFLAAAKQDDPAKEAAVVKFLQYISDPERVSEWALSSGAMFFIKYTPSPETSLISQKFTEISNNASYTILHVNGAFPTAFSTEFPAAVSALVLNQIDEEGFVDQLQTAIELAE
ncbi:MAG: extracellular solute-binding protein [Oscillospiraceae bacterium]|nr:extracellular solute-binding protein [Oscillospiraceae bacterium]